MQPQAHLHPLAARHQALGEEARTHKREQARHREAARACRRQQAEIAAQCRRLGIELIEIPRERGGPDRPERRPVRRAAKQAP